MAVIIVMETVGIIIMGDPSVYLEKLSLFSRMLRLEGVTVTPKETADAATILTMLGLVDREQVKSALRTVYARSREEQLTFDRVFDGFFISEEQMRQQAKEQAERDQQIQQARMEAEDDLQVNGQSMDLSPQQMETYVTMPQSERDRLRNFMERYRDNMERNPELYSSFIHSVFAKSLLEQQMRMEDAAVGGNATDPELGLLFRDISRFKDIEIPKAISIIQTLSHQLSGELTSQKKAASRSGKIDFRATIRKGLETGGSLYRLRYKKKRDRRRHLVLLCDVSGSMVQFSEFALRFIQSLDQVSESSRVFLFSEEIFEADRFSLQNMDLFRNYVKECGIYGKGTDLGHALTRLCSETPAVLNPSTTLLILSDTKTIDQPRALASLVEAKRQSGRVLWLNPIPQRHWQGIRSAQVFGSVCPMVACDTLHALAEACRHLVTP